MSCVFVSTGQCGNQLTFSLIDQISRYIDTLPESSKSFHTDIFFRESSTKLSSTKSRLVTRAVCLDTEPKVINECLKKAYATKSWNYDANSVAYLHGGAGNNWAQGNEMCSGEFLSVALDCIRREIELCDRAPYLLVPHSLAGGTGSGLGTKLSEHLAVEHPDTTRVNIAITPYHSGEVVVQYYNAVLALAKLQNVSDGVLLYENETANSICCHMRGIQRPLLDDINYAIATTIMPALVPKSVHQQFNSISSGNVNCTSHSFADDIRHLCCHSSYKFIDVKYVPLTRESSVEFTSDTWASLIQSITRMQTKGISDNRLHSASDTVTTLSSSMTLHGYEEHSPLLLDQRYSNSSQMKNAHSSHASSLRSTLSPSLALSHDIRSSNPILCYNAPHSDIIRNPILVNQTPFNMNGFKRSVSLLSNSTVVAPLLSRVASKAADLYASRAYVHQYLSHGIEENDFLEAFYTVGQVVSDYSSLLPKSII